MKERFEDMHLARLVAFGLVRIAARKHGGWRYDRAAQFARKCGDKSERLGRGRALWDAVGQLCLEARP